MKQAIKHFFVTALIIAGIDAVWLTTMASRLYKPELGDLLAETPNGLAIVLFYLIYVVGVVVFVVAPALSQESLKFAATRGALLGLVAYATYDLTNLATLQGFSMRLAMIDIVWGTTLTASASVLAYLLLSRKAQ